MSPPAARGQDSSAIEPDALVNLSYDHTYGFGGYSVGDQDVTLIQVPISVTLRSLEKYKWGLRLRISGVLGIHNFEKIEDFEIESIRSILVVPGIEFLIPTGQRSLLRPFLDVGVARAEGGATIPVSAGGIRWEYLIPWKMWEFGVEPRIQYSLAKTSSKTDDDNWADFGFFTDARHPLWFKIGGHQPDAGVYFESGYLFNELSFVTGTGSPLKINQQYEVGVSLGFRDRAKIWLVTLPRLGVGYRFGGGLRGIRIRIGGNRMLRLPFSED